MATNDTRGAEGDVVERMRQLVEAMAPQTFAEVRVTVGDLDALVRLAECGLDAGAAPAPRREVTELADALLDAVVAATALRHWVPLERLDTPEGKDAMARLRRAANVSGAHNWGNPHPDRDAAERRAARGESAVVKALRAWLDAEDAYNRAGPGDYIERLALAVVDARATARAVLDAYDANAKGTTDGRELLDSALARR